VVTLLRKGPLHPKEDSTVNTSTPPQVLPATALSSTRAVERALTLLAEVCAAGPIALSDCARRVSVPTSTALRLLRTMEAHDFVNRNPDGLYGAGPRLLQIGATAFGRQDLLATVRPALDRIVERTGESSYLSVRGPIDTALYLDVVEGTHSIKHTSWVGRTVPLGGSAVGSVLQGHVGTTGYVAMRSAVEPDVTAIAAPIHRPGGIVGAISLIGPTYRIDEELMTTYGAIVSGEALALSTQFGFSRPTARK
jgi:urocanate hydratase